MLDEDAANAEPEPRDRPTGRLARRLLVLAAIAYASGIVIVPLLEQAGWTAAGLGHLLYAPVCHQLPERSFAVGEHPLSVCARCTGLYAGGVIGLLTGTWIASRRAPAPRPLWLAVLAFPSLVDATLPRLGVAEGLTSLPRMGLALPPGMLLGIYLAIGIHDLFVSRTKLRATRTECPASVLEGLDG
ncbi:MAG TPA: DUF2085 domain-containing protein [Candidatus Polarisedimenticolaceae bacterium]|nr:DUF2085 domain-containing protein [Candidatus Polarisedimenticolaceae bacterium]